MTTEKAIEQLEDLIKDRESFCHRDDFDDIFLQDIEALKVGISSLEKQIPKKLEKHNRIVYFCPCCFKIHYKLFQSNRCKRCGQALDWSDENE